MTKVSIVIPHKGRDSILLWHLRELEKQTYQDFELIVVIDDMCDSESYLANELPNSLWSGGIGPGASRNLGAEQASGDIILILGSDCIPDKNLVARHVYEHEFHGADIVQGYTLWHPDVITPFYDFIDASGLQAAWSNLKDKNGKWHREVSPSFCLTTNWSIKRQLLLSEPFDARLDPAAYDDIDLGYRLSKYNDAIKQVFSPDAVNYHYHRYDFDSFLQRSRMEGYNRLKLCKIHPEMGWNMVNPFELRVARRIEEQEIVSWAKELDSVSMDRDTEQVKELRKIKYERYAEACKTFSLKGVLDRIKDEHPAMQAIEHVHTNEQVIQILSGVNALEDGHIGYAAHCAQWYVSERSDDWAAYSFLGEVEIAAGNINEARNAFEKSLMINPGEEWPKKRIKEMA